MDSHSHRPARIESLSFTITRGLTPSRRSHTEPQGTILVLVNPPPHFTPAIKSREQQGDITCYLGITLCPCFRNWQKFNGWRLFVCFTEPEVKSSLEPNWLKLHWLIQPTGFWPSLKQKRLNLPPVRRLRASYYYLFFKKDFCLVCFVAVLLSYSPFKQKSSHARHFSGGDFSFQERFLKRFWNSENCDSVDLQPVTSHSSAHSPGHPHASLNYTFYAFALIFVLFFFFFF